jgi:hypothetical protein
MRKLTCRPGKRAVFRCSYLAQPLHADSLSALSGLLTDVRSRDTVGGQRSAFWTRAEGGGGWAAPGIGRPAARKCRATLGKSHAADGKCRATFGNCRATNGKSRVTFGKCRATDGKSRATDGKCRATFGKSHATNGKSRATFGVSRATNDKSRATFSGKLAEFPVRAARGRVGKSGGSQ